MNLRRFNLFSSPSFFPENTPHNVQQHTWYFFPMRKAHAGLLHALFLCIAGKYYNSGTYKTAHFALTRCHIYYATRSFRKENSAKTFNAPQPGKKE